MTFSLSLEIELSLFIVSSKSISMATSTHTDVSAKKIRKPYTITKSRESWSDEEHDKFIEALQMFDRDWKKIEDFVGSKSVIQIRSHAQKYFLKVQKNGTTAHVPPPRPKRKAAYPYPQKALKNALMPLQASSVNHSPEYYQWDDDSMLLNSESSGIMEAHDDYTNFYNIEDKIGSMERIGNRVTGKGSSSSDILKQRKQVPVNHGSVDFPEVYYFIGSIFDPNAKNHVQKLKEMDPINIETVLLLMRNLTVNLSSPDFEEDGRG